MWLDFLSQRCSRPERRPTRLRPASCRLAVEALEDRAVPSFVAPVSTPGLSAGLVGDFNNDGIADILGGSAGSFGVMLGKGNGTFQPPNALPGSINNVQIGDVNGDGKLDLVGLDAQGITAFLGKGDGTFLPASSSTSLPNGQSAGSPAIGDLNNDGKLDLAVVGSIVTYSNNNHAWGFPKSVNFYVNVLLGNGDGSFRVAGTMSVAGGNIALGDFNRDGKLDVLDAGQGIYLLLGNGAGTLKSPKAVDKFAYAGSLKAADLNGDGKLDFLVTYNTNSTTFLSVYLGNGDGTFQATKTSAVGDFLERNLVVGDFDRDGKLDILTINQVNDGSGTIGSAGATISVRLGNGDGTFQAAQDFAAGPTSTDASLLVGDFNGDGWLDLVVSRLDEDYFGNVSFTLGLLLNDGRW
jgi:hypothetical protein